MDESSFNSNNKLNKNDSFGVQFNENVLNLIHDEGFFSNCSVTLRALFSSVKFNEKIIVNWPTQDKYRNEDQKGKNLFNEYFEESKDFIPMQFYANNSWFENLAGYKDLDFEKITPFIMNYFNPSNSVQKKIQALIKKYSIIPELTIALYYRCKDKCTELNPVDIDLYIRIVNKLLEENSDLRVLVQTDSYFIRDRCLREFKERAFFIEELPVTDTNKGMHKMSPQERGISNFELGENFLATVIIMSQCSKVITSTGNVGLWIYLYRGNGKNALQLCSKNKPSIESDKTNISKSGGVEENFEVIGKFEPFKGKYFVIRENLNKNEFELIHDAGFFGTCTGTLKKLMVSYPRPSYIQPNWPKSDRWRDPQQNGKNLFLEYFTPSYNFDPMKLEAHRFFENSDVCKDLNYSILNPYIKNYFNLSDVVKKIKESLIKKYNIDFRNTLVLYYRGTDKWIEVTPIHIDCFIDAAKEILEKHDNLRVLVQTDEESVRSRCLKEFGKRAFFIEELPVTDTNKGMHEMSPLERGISNFEFGATFLAATSIMSECEYVVTSTGNIGVWICLFRGNANNVVQILPLPQTYDLSVGLRKSLYSGGWKDRKCLTIKNFIELT